MSSHVYDSLDRLVHERTSTNGLSAFEIGYSYDLAGNRLSKTLNNPTVITYQPCTGNRLASSSTAIVSNTLFVSGSSSELIGLDDRWGELFVSNVTAGASATPSVNGSTFFASVPAVAGQTNTVVAAIRDAAGNTDHVSNSYWVASSQTGAVPAAAVYDHDAAGCLTNLNGTSLEWDERCRLVTASTATSLVDYAYDVLDRRVSRIEGAATNYFIYNGSQVVADLDGSGNLLRTYVWGPGIDNLLSMTVYTNGGAQASATYYAIKDHQNTVLALVDESGAVVETYEYTAYGETRVFNASGTELPASGIGNRYTFQGREIDWSTGLIYFRARWYDPETGRWLSKDPIGIAGGLNLYEFCGSNPVFFVDPDGLKEEDPEIPEAPPGVDVDDNIREAQGHKNPFWFRDQVKNKGPWDYKQQGSQYENFGNFNYGATGAAMGIFSKGTLLQQAGAAQRAAGTSKPEWNKSNSRGRLPPYGDDPKDQEWIEKGWDYYQKNKDCF